MVFVAIVVLCVLSAVVYTVFAARRAAQRAQVVSANVASPDALTAVVKQPHLVFVDDASRHIAVAPLSAPDGPRLLTPLACQRVYVAADQGLCLASNAVGTVDNGGTYSFDTSFTVTHTYPELGLPSRVRLSPHGTLGATTVFVAGDSYNAAGLSTRTNLFDIQNGVELDDLEDFSVYFGNKPFQSADFNFWGVTFASDDDEFYATLGTGGTTYLVHGNRDGHMEVVRENVECPSLSPDNTRIVFKERAKEPNVARFPRVVEFGPQRIGELVDDARHIEVGEIRKIFLG